MYWTNNPYTSVQDHVNCSSIPKTKWQIFHNSHYQHLCKLMLVLCPSTLDRYLGLKHEEGSMTPHESRLWSFIEWSTIWLYLLILWVMSTPSFDKGVGCTFFQLCVAKIPLLRMAVLLEEAYQVPLAIDSSTQHNKVGNLLQNPSILPFHIPRMIYNHEYQF